MQTSNSIYIIGTGAVGKTLEVLLQQEGKNVILVRGSVDQQPAYTATIRVLLPEDKETVAAVPVHTLSDFPYLDGIIMVTTKSYGNRELAGKLHTKVRRAPVVILQNGLGIEDDFTGYAFPQVYRCVLFATSQLIETGVLRFKPVAASPVGIIRGSVAMLARITRSLTSTHFVFCAEQNIQLVAWRKTIVNSVFNTICPLLETDNGIFARDTRALDIAKRIIDECVALAAIKGILLDKENILESLLLISKSSSGQLISTYQDILQKRPTEIGTLNFAIVKYAAELNQTELVKETRLLGELVRIKSEGVHRL